MRAVLSWVPTGESFSATALVADRCTQCDPVDGYSVQRSNMNNVIAKRLGIRFED
jgi:hypothetical protein